MTSIKLRYVDRFVDRHGTARHYFRGPGGKRQPLPGMPGSDEFLDVYRRALAGDGVERTRTKVAGGPGTFQRIAQSYFESPDFLALKPRTRYVSHKIYDRFLAEHGHRLVADMERSDVLKLMGQKAETPAAANDFLKRLRTLIRFAIDDGLRRDDPTLRVKRYKEGEHHTWNEDEIAIFEKRWPLGTRERTAFALHLYTAQRSSDVARLRWSDIRDGSLHVVQDKTGTELNIAIHPVLALALSRWKKRHVTILTTAFNRPFSTAGYGNWLASAIDKAGLPERCVVHGLRKAASRRLAENAATAKQIAAVTGHKKLDEVARYTRAADQRRLATAAIALLPEQNPDEDSQP